ncbi:lysophospholipid acyltransferase family protein [Comamonadaceae bacterium SL12-8]|uniref:Lysophospholipid acyltransferase family protein n=1 Tax=Amphibiibacter pelophylacis TaxID=1799477 RepID=A0ACC6P3N5_9BURK
MSAASTLLGAILRLVTSAQGHWQGCPPSAEQRIYFANHQSHVDWVLIWATLPADLRQRTRPIAARDYWQASRLRHWLTREVFNAVYVNRQRTDDQDPLEPLVEALHGGDSIVIFPEGTRGHAVVPQAFKSGLFHLAQAFPQVPLVPVWMSNVQKVLPKNEVVPVPMLCVATYGTPLQLEPDEEKAAFLARTRQALLDLGQARGDLDASGGPA